MKSAKTAYLIVICTGVVSFWLANIFHQKGVDTGEVDFYKWFVLVFLAIGFLYAMSFGFLYSGAVKYGLKTALFKTLFAGIAIVTEYYMLKNIADYNMFIGVSGLAILSGWNLAEFYPLYKSTRKKEA